ncbi:MAG TPA: nitroreductase family protein [Candidatus Onthomorpha intestinigallinarum]|uniref:Nitroreductase family protein n=1 Tax=Candidatus Onthomorpha intestinigallinarum TaxID=2840880 RepID=A0A9D1RK83_9BACT|nr:nitroreductase family protein [Candidatus Onthomorpha intestinigallinarum]
MDRKLIESLLNRRTVRKYTEEDIPQDVLNTVIEAGVRASNCGNMQIYSIIVTKDKQRKQELCKLHFNQPMVREAPVVLTVCADVNRFHKYCQNRNAPVSYNNFLWLNVGTVDATICTQAMCDAAESLGLGICYLGTVTYMAEPIAEFFNLPKGVVPITTITMGYPKENPGLTERLPLNAVVHYESYKDYSADDINELYKDFEDLPQIRKYIEESKQENLAQVFTNVRYKKEDALVFGKNYLEFLKKQDMF